MSNDKNVGSGHRRYVNRKKRQETLSKILKRRQV